MALFLLLRGTDGWFGAHHPASRVGAAGVVPPVLGTAGPVMRTPSPTAPDPRGIPQKWLAEACRN